MIKQKIKISEEELAKSLKRDSSTIRQKSINNIKSVKGQQKSVLNTFTRTLQNPDLNNLTYLGTSCHLETKSINLKGSFQKRKMLFSECSQYRSNK